MKKTLKSRFKKSIVCIILCSLLLSCYPIAVSAASFTDIDGHWAEEYIDSQQRYNVRHVHYHLFTKCGYYTCPVSLVFVKMSWYNIG